MDAACGAAVAQLDWISDAVVYQIFVDRFARGDRGRAPMEAAHWGRGPAASIMGGNLNGITDRLAYLQNLGVNVLCLTPIFMSSSNHRYNTYDYYRIDPRLGTLDDFRTLLAEAHRRSIRVLLDGVFNHCGRGFYPFYDVMENGGASPWRDWFYIDAFPVDAYGTHRFRAWQDDPSVPEFNLGNPDARDYLLRVAEYWTAQGIDGWRLDAVPHVRHRAFWAELRNAVKRVNPSVYLQAEIWEDPQPWLESGYFDGATNYRFRDLVLQFVIERSLRPTEFAQQLATLVTRQSWAITLGMYNLIGSHDTARIWTLARGDLHRVQLALMLQFFFPGIPAIYYGDEVGLDGETEPDDRRAMQWDTSRWNTELRGFVQRLVAARRTLRALQRGGWETVLADDERGICVFRRPCGSESAILVVHNGDREHRFALDLDTERLPATVDVEDPLTGRALLVRGTALDFGILRPHTCLLVSSRTPSAPL